uniref:Uncharacterized protein n=1 Tax=Lepeophtheirus salmonis TaxID=72036 RepID=A0A0K2V589_LEPSM
MCEVLPKLQEVTSYQKIVRGESWFLVLSKSSDRGARLEKVKG